MASVIQKLKENYEEKRSLDNVMYDLNQKRMHIIEKLYDDVIIPTAKKLRYDVFLDIYHPVYNNRKDVKHTEWQGGDVPEFIKLVNNDMRKSCKPLSSFTNFQTLLMYKMETPVIPTLLAKKDKETEKYGRPINLILRDKHLEVQDPITDFYNWSLIVGSESPKKKLYGILAGWELEHGNFLKLKEVSFKAASMYYAEILDSRGFKNVGKPKRVGRHYEIKASNVQNDWAFKIHDKGSDVKVRMDIDDAVFEGGPSNVTVFKKGRVLAEGGKLVKGEEKVTVKQYFEKKPKFSG